MSNDSKKDRKEDRATEPETMTKMKTMITTLDSIMRNIKLESKRLNGARRRKRLPRKLRPRRRSCCPST